MKKISVCQIIAPQRLYGKEKWLLAFLKHLDPDRFASSVITLTRDGSSAISEQLDRIRIPVYPIRIAEKFNFKSIREISGIIRSNDVEILHSHDYKSNLKALITGRRTGISILSTPHGWSITKDPKLRLYEALDRFMLRYFDMVVPLSSGLSAKLHFVKDEKIILIKNFIDLSSIPDRSEYDINTVAFIGRLVPLKRVTDILTAISLAKNREITLQVIGDGPLRKSLEDQVAGLGISSRVKFLGFREDALDLLSRTSALILPSTTEGTPRTAMEAMAMGIPVIGSDIPGIRSIIRHEQTGILVPVMDPSAIANQLDRITGNPDLYGRINRTASVYIRENHSAEAAAIRYGEVYEKLATSGDKGSGNR